MASFQSEARDGWLIIKCSMNLDAKVTQDYLKSLSEWMAESQVGIIVDFSRVFKIEKEFFKAVVQTKSALKGSGKWFHSIGLNEAQLKKVRAEGMEAAFSPKKSFEDVVVSHSVNENSKVRPGAQGESHAEAKGTGSANQLNMDFISPFLIATKKTFETQIQTQIKPIRPYLKTESIPGVDIAGVLTLVSQGSSGSFVMCFSQDVFLKVYGRMVGEEFDRITPEIEDAASEIVNIVYGLAKMDLNTKGYSFPRAFPTVLTGEKISIRQSGSGPAVIMPFETDLGRFHIEIEFENGTS